MSVESPTQDKAVKESPVEETQAKETHEEPKTAEEKSNVNTAAPAKVRKKLERKAAKTNTKSVSSKTGDKKMPRVRAPKKVKKVAKSTKAKSNGQAKAKKSSKPHKSRPAKDDARKVARASDGALNPDQVRILRVLRDNGRGELNRNQIKEAVGIGIDKKYSGSWLKSLWALMEQKPALMFISEYEPDQKQRAHHMHSITADGRKVLERAEKAASKVE